jgi:tetratricopeptide (TPR) repeat protein
MLAVKRPILPAAALLLAAASMTAGAKSATEVFEAVAPSVVVVQVEGAGGKVRSFGSGVIVAAGQVVTNCHVVDKAADIRVKRGRLVLLARLRHADWERDVCSLEVAGLAGPAVALGETRSLKVGQKVYVVGAPQGLELTLSDGILSGLREVDGGRYLQITAPISPGSSGGGLFDEQGRLIGLTTFYLGQSQQLNFAVPVEWVTALPQRAARSNRTDTLAGTWLARAIELEESKDWRALSEHAQRWTKAQPNAAAAWYALGIAYDNSGQTAQAIEAYRQALRIQPDNADAWNNLGVAYNDAGQTAQAIETYRQALRIQPDNADAWYNLGNAYSNAGQTAQAIEAYRQALRIRPECAKAWYNLGIAYNDAGQTAQAIEAYRQALRIRPEYAKAWYNLGIAYDDAGQTAQAIEAYRQALRIRPDYADAWYNLGLAYRLAGQRSQVTEVYRRLKQLDPALADEFFEKILVP